MPERVQPSAVAIKIILQVKIILRRRGARARVHKNRAAKSDVSFYSPSEISRLLNVFLFFEEKMCVFPTFSSTQNIIIGSL